MKKLLTMFAIVCAFLASCDSEGGDLNRTPLLKVVGPDGSDPSQPISIDGKSQEVAFTVLATADWTADIAGDEGFALSDRSGATGNTKVTVVAARNLSGATRSATVSFRLGGEERYAYTISQTEEQPYLDVDPATISYGRHWLATIIIRSPMSSAYATCTSMVLVSLKPGLLSRPEKFREITGMKPYPFFSSALRSRWI